MVDTIDRDALKEKLDSDDEFVLVNVLSPEQFEEQHIPGSINIPLDQVEEEFPARFDRDEKIVVYCASPSCEASPKAAQKLEAMGFSDVTDYEGGMTDWADEYPVSEA